MFLLKKKKKMHWKLIRNQEEVEGEEAELPNQS